MLCLAQRSIKPIPRRRRTKGEKSSGKPERARLYYISVHCDVPTVVMQYT